MHLVPAHLGFAVADGERVEISFSNGDLVLRFVDWKEQPVEARFPEALAFRWSGKPSVEVPRDDATYEVIESPWLLEEVEFEGCVDPEGFAHYLLCFNALKVLEVIARRTTA